jgi:uncharacterized protein (DUF433 family)
MFGRVRPLHDLVHPQVSSIARNDGLLAVPRSGQIVFTEVVESFLREISFDAGYACLIHLRQYRGADVVMDPDRSYGHPIFDRAGVEVENVLGRIRAGEPLEVTAKDFGLRVPELRAALAVSA